MKQLKSTALALLLALSTNYALSKEPSTCLEKAMTQAEMNECSNMSFQMADGELNRVYTAIKSRYSDDKLFLKKLKKAQLAWIKTRDADFEMKFPHSQNPSYYGSVFSMCADGYKTELTLKRIAFLKQWLIGGEEGDFCNGSKQTLDNETEDTIKTVCYENIYSDKKNSAMKDVTELKLTINYGDGTVKGTYNYRPAEKDQRLGKIDGSLWKGAISATYNFEQEGQKDSVNLRIYLEENKAVVEGEEKDKSLGLSETIKEVTCK